MRRIARGALDIPRVAMYSLRWDLMAGLCAGAYQGLAFPFFVKIARGDLHAHANLIALMAAAPFVGNLLSPIWARQMEGRAKMPFCLGSWLPARFLLLLMPFAVTAPGFVALVFGVQFIGTISSPAYTSIMRDIYPDRARGRLLGYVRMIAQIAMFGATLVAGRLLDHGLTYRQVFPVAGILGMLAAFFFAKVRALPAPTPVAPAAAPPSTAAFVRDTLSVLRDNVPFRWFALSVTTYGFGNLMTGPLYALYQVDVLHIANTQIANLANFGSLMAIAGFFFWGRFMDKRGAPRTVLYGILTVLLVPLVYIAHPSIPTLFIASGLFSFGQSCIDLSYLQSILTYAEKGKAAQYQSVHSLLLGIRGVIAPLVGIPLMRQFGYDTVFWLALLIMGTGAIMQYFATQPHRMQRKTA